MKIVSWNCQNGLNEVKANAIRELHPDADIFIIQECRRTDIYAFKNDWKFKNWYGDDWEKRSDLGIAVFSKKHDIGFTDVFNREFRYVIPYKVKADKKTLILFIVWTKPVPHSYDKNVTQAVSYYKDVIIGEAILIGDFNTFAKNDNGRLEVLEREMNPLINCAKDTKFWETPTYFHNEKDGYGINDFCFASESIYADIKEIKIHDDWEENQKGQKSWSGLSDHCPIMVEFDF